MLDIGYNRWLKRHGSRSKGHSFSIGRFCFCRHCDSLLVLQFWGHFLQIEIQSFVSLFGGNALKIVTLTDYHNGDKNKIDRLKKSGLLSANRVFLASDYTQYPTSDIEDIIGKEPYIKLVNACYGLSADAKINGKTSKTAMFYILSKMFYHLTQRFASIIIDQACIWFKILISGQRKTSLLLWIDLKSSVLISMKHFDSIPW